MIRISLIFLVQFPIILFSKFLWLDHIESISVYEFGKYFERDLDPLKSSDLKVAVITAGELRSLYFNKESWNKYLISSFKKNLYLFASVVAPPPKENCPLSHLALTYLHHFASAYDVSYSTSTIQYYPRDNDTYMPYCQDGVDNVMVHGNIIDMFQRRARAYYLAESYAEQHKIEWDLVVFVRLDSAFYSSSLDFRRIHRALLSFTFETKKRGILVPKGCGFSGVCDRMAIGLPDVMHDYFQIKVRPTAHWAKSTPDPTISHIREKYDELEWCESEMILGSWLLMHHITPIDMSALVSFLTLRTECGSIYCHSSRATLNRSDCFASWDITVLYPPTSSDFSSEDLIEDSTFRCGKSQWYNLSRQQELCTLYSSCGCRLPKY